MTASMTEWSDFSVNEWHRLDNLSATHEQALKTAYLQTVTQNRRLDMFQIRRAITNAVIDIASTTAPVYGMLFNPQSPVYNTLVDDLTANYLKITDNREASNKVKGMVPRGLSMTERRKRLDTFGLDARSAIQIERMHQDGAAPADIQRERLKLVVQRGNLIATTEVNRIVNMTLETLWMDNLSVGKAEDDNVWYFDRSVPKKIKSITQLPGRARKEWLTRRDDRVCNYCLPLEGVKARLGAEFDTEYGLFQCPPIHPRCRCFMIVSI